MQVILKKYLFWNLPVKAQEQQVKVLLIYPMLKKGQLNISREVKFLII